MPTFILNDKTLECPEGETVLEAARRIGVEIPSLCRHPTLKSVGACRVCLVEAGGPGLRPTVIASCTLKVIDGLEVRTDTDAVAATRRTVLALLLARAPESKRIRAIARHYGVKEERYARQDAGNCILCGLCTRVCEEVVGREAITFAGRSTRRTVSAAFGDPSSTCIGCGACANLCPTGAVRKEIDGTRGRIINHERLISDLEMIRCESCDTPFATEALHAWVRKRMEDGFAGCKEVPRLCPRCARRFQAKKVAGGGE